MLVHPLIGDLCGIYQPTDQPCPPSVRSSVLPLEFGLALPPILAARYQPSYQSPAAAAADFTCRGIGPAEASLLC